MELILKDDLSKYFQGIDFDEGPEVTTINQK